MKKKALPKPITLLILTLLTAALWVGLSVYRTLAVKPASPVPENIVKALDPKLNTQVIQKIESAIYIPDSEIPPLNIEGGQGFSAIATPVPTVSPEVSPEASPAASPTP